MAIDKGLYAAPAGISDMEDTAGMPEIEIEIEDPESVTIGIDGLEIEIEPAKPSAEDFDANLADFMDDSELQSLSTKREQSRGQARVVYFTPCLLSLLYGSKAKESWRPFQPQAL